MSTCVRSILVVGSDGLAIDVECQFSNGLPSIIIVGLGSKAVDEAKERIRSAFASTGLKLPRLRITINLAPADVPKESSSYDLAIAGAIMEAAYDTAHVFSDTQAVIGEVGLDGSVKPVRGIIGKIIAGKRLGMDTFVIPAGNSAQAALIPEVSIRPVANIKELHAALCENESSAIGTAFHTGNPRPTVFSAVSPPPALSAIAGQERAKRALEIAAAGGHNILLSGPPGTGKSMLAKALASLLPPMSQQEVLEVTQLHSLASKTYDRLITERPFRSPHHSSSHISIVGGGNNARPGEVSLSHRGVLLLDEIPEFDRLTLEALRQPLEDRVITVARSKATVEYPADFLLVATANPCPCGYYGSGRPCQCSPYQVITYRRKLSGPILDRIDLFVTVSGIDHKLLLQTPRAEVGNDRNVMQRIIHARRIQQQRTGQMLNARMTNDEVKHHSHISEPAAQLLNEGAKRLELSPRAYMRTIKVARTIADLEHSENIDVAHITEALQYRPTPVDYTV